MESRNIKGTALITGGSSGLGLAIAREMAARNYNLILVSNQPEQLRAACDELTTAYNVITRPVISDLTETGAAAKLYAWCLQENFNVDVLVNCAGILIFDELVRTSADRILEIITLHTVIPAQLCSFFGKEMKKRRSGHILNISSLAAFMPYPGISLYSATKVFLKSFSRSLRTEMLDYQVNVTCVLPGAVATSLFHLDPARRDRLIRTGVLMKPEKVAHLAVNGMFRRKSMIFTGFFTCLFLILVLIIPQGLIVWLRRHTKILPPEGN
jgi:short-subunit dehydrogenase